MGLFDSILTQVIQATQSPQGAQAPAAGALMGAVLGALMGGQPAPQSGQAPQSSAPPAPSGQSPVGLSQAGNGVTGALVAAGVSILVTKLQQGGLQEAVNSWVGHGDNKPVDPDALHAALGADQVKAMSAQTGLPTAALMGVLAAALPQIINSLTPQGRLPEAHEVPHDALAAWSGGQATA